MVRSDPRSRRGLLQPELELDPDSRFEIVRVLGEGGMGVVYEAIDHLRNVHVALKTLRTEQADALLRFKNEFRALQDLHHPNLVSLGELREENGHLFFTMELVEGVRFLDWIRPRAPAPEAPPPPPSAGAADQDTLVKRRPPRDARKPAPSSEPSSPPPRFDEARLRDAFAQLGRGLHALHSAGKVHRDVKPSNVLVTREGQVKILDFGLVMDLAQGEREWVVVGTARYMAPEQASGLPIGPAADWYSVGVMLYLAVTGTFPFNTRSDPPDTARRRARATPPGVLVPGLAPDLDALCVDLLHPVPESRPRGPEVMRRLGAQEDDEPFRARPRDALFVGRRAEIAALESAFAAAATGVPRAVLIEGESGMGKSALMRRFLERISHGAVVLRGRCFQRESVPYKAVDELMDDLGLYLSRLPPSSAQDLLPPGAELLEQVFPVLRLAPSSQRRSLIDLPPRVDSFSSAADHTRAPISVRLPRAAALARSALDPQELRAKVFTALRELLRRLAERGPLVLAIDDLQWADADSLSLLAEVMRPPGAPPLLLVATQRTSSIVSRRPVPELSPELLEILPLDPLTATDGLDLVAGLLAPAGAAAGAAINAESLVQEAGGHPLFLDALLRHRLAHEGQGPVRLDEALSARIDRLEPRSRKLLELIACAGGPLRRDVAERALAAERDEIARLAGPLRGGNLIRIAGESRDEIADVYHDRVRETVLRHMDAAEQRAWHGRLALAMESTGRGGLEELAVHWRDAGDAARASGYAARAGAEAARTFAFDHASRLYRMALELTRGGLADESTLSACLAEALANAGHGAEAARAYLRAARGAPPAEALDHERRAAENFLRSGYVDEGLGTLRKVATAFELGIPRTPELALGSLLLGRARLRFRGLAHEERSEDHIPRADLQRIDVCWSAALGLAMVDVIRAASFQTQCLLLTLAAGEPYRVARSLAFEAGFLSTTGSSSEPRVAELLARASAYGERTGHPHVLGLVELVRGVSEQCFGRFRSSLEALDRADVIFREKCTGVPWERGSTASFAAWNLWFLGELSELSRRVPIYLREAEERGDRYFEANLRICFTSAASLLAGDPDRALAEVDAGLRAWSKEGFHLQHFFDFFARGHIALYRGDGEAAHRRVIEGWPRLSRSLTLRMEFARASSFHLRGRTALSAVATAPSSSRNALIAEAERCAGKLERERAAWIDPLGAILRAGVASCRGELGRARARLADAIRGFDRAGMTLFAQAAHRRRGELTGGDEGRAEAEAAYQWMRAEGVAEPDRMTAMMAPGFRG